MTALTITSLSKSFRAGAPGCSATVTVLRDLDLAIWPGEIVAVEGAAGSGRSTLLRCAAGLLRPDVGAIHWFGARLSRSDAVAYVSAGSEATISSRHAPAGGALPAQRPTRPTSGALYAALESLSRHTRLLLVDDLATVGALERSLALALLRRHALAGAAILLSATTELATDSRLTRVETLSLGALVQRRNRSAARTIASSPASRARASAP